MHHRGIPFSLIIGLFTLYTAFKIKQIFRVKFLWSLLGAAVLFTLILGWQFLYRNGNLPEAGQTISIVAWVGSVVLGFWATFFLFSFPYDVILLVGLGARKLSAQAPVDRRRRQIFTQMIPAGILGLATAASAAGMGEALAGPRVESVEIPVDDLPQALDGLHIAQISDMHISPVIDRAYVESVVKQVLDLKADLIVLTGDLADGTPEDLSQAIEPLARLKAPLGSYYVTGNHEYYWDADEWLAAGRDMGFTTLVNESKILSYNETEFALGGVTDTSSAEFNPRQKSDPRKAMGRHQNLPLRILLAHRPESCIEAEKAGWQVQLSGHTHGGQFFPFSLLIPLAHRYYKGLNRHKNLWLYVNRGTGYWGPPDRLGIRAEVTSVIIRKAKT